VRNLAREVFTDTPCIAPAAVSHRRNILPAASARPLGNRRSQRSASWDRSAAGDREMWVRARRGSASCSSRDSAGRRWETRRSSAFQPADPNTNHMPKMDAFRADMSGRDHPTPRSLRQRGPSVDGGAGCRGGLTRVASISFAPRCIPRYTEPMAKVMVSIPDDLLGEVDAQASRLCTSRSAVLRDFADAALRRRRSDRATAMSALLRHAGRYGGGAAERVKTTRP
jgi:hypothetical protein